MSDLSVFSADSIGNRSPARAALINADTASIFLLDISGVIAVVSAADNAGAAAAAAFGRGGAESTAVYVVVV